MDESMYDLRTEEDVYFIFARHRLKYGGGARILPPPFMSLRMRRWPLRLVWVFHTRPESCDRMLSAGAANKHVLWVHTS